MNEKRLTGLRIATTAKGMLDGTIDILEGCRKIVALRYQSIEDDELDDALKVMVAIESQTDEFPLGTARKHWAPEVLARMDEQRDRYLAQENEDILAACRTLYERWKPEPLLREVFELWEKDAGPEAIAKLEQLRDAEPGPTRFRGVVTDLIASGLEKMGRVDEAATLLLLSTETDGPNAPVLAFARLVLRWELNYHYKQAALALGSLIQQQPADPQHVTEAYELLQAIKLQLGR